ncbi:MAG: MFS transporter, partial [candidate division NC10 bacterium]|nr:MFS transporter [candidate division NC10 bacterium]
MDRGEGKEILLLGLSHALVHGYMLILPAVLLLLMREFQAGYFLLGILGTISNFAFGLGALPAGFLSDRLGARRLILLYLFGSAFSAILISFSQSILHLAISLGLLGLFCSLYHPCSLALLSHLKERGKAFGIVGALGNVGLALSPLLAANLASQLGWRRVFPFFSLAGLILSVSYLFLQRGRLSSPERVRREKAGLPPSSGKGRLFNLRFAMLLCMQMLAGFSFQGATTFLPTYLSRRVQVHLFGLDPVGIGGVMASVSLIVGVFGQYLGGYLGQKMRTERLYLAMVSATLPALLLTASSTNAILVASAAAFAFFYFCAQPMGNILLASFTSASVRGRGYGV